MVASAPTPVALFGHAGATDGWVFVTGQMPTDPVNDRAPLSDGVEAQNRRVVENLQIVLAGAGSTLARVVFARVCTSAFRARLPAMNLVCQSYFATGKQVALNVGGGAIRPPPINSGAEIATAAIRAREKLTAAGAGNYHRSSRSTT